MLLLLEIVWGVASAIGIAIGVEPTKTWKKVFKGGLARVGSSKGGSLLGESARRMLLFASLGMSGFAIFCAFYFFVTSNAVIVLVAWILAFVLARFTIEILQRREYVDETVTATAMPVAPKPAAPRLMYSESYEEDRRPAAPVKKGKAEPAPLPAADIEPVIKPSAAPAPEPLKAVEENPVPEEEKGTSVESGASEEAPIPRIDLNKYPNLRPKTEVDLARKAPALPRNLPVYTAKKNPMPQFEERGQSEDAAPASAGSKPEKASAFKPEDFEGEPGIPSGFNTGTYNDIFKRLNGNDPDS